MNQSLDLLQYIWGYASIIPYTHVLLRLLYFLTVLNVFFTSLCEISSQYKFCVDLEPVKTLLTCVQCGLCLHFHKHAPVLWAVSPLARYDWGLCGYFAVSRLPWQNYAKPMTQDRQAGEDITERLWWSVYSVFQFHYISELMYCCLWKTNAFLFSQNLVLWIYTAYVTLKALMKTVD